MKKRILAFLLCAVFVSAPVWANYIGDFMKAGIDVTSNVMKVSKKALKLGENTTTPTTTQTDHSLFVESTLEVDGAVRLDNASITLRGVPFTLPAADGAAGSTLSTNGSGVLSWSAAGAGVTLDGAYDQGGAGVGRTITASDGAVVIQNTDADTTNILEINKSPSGGAAGAGIAVTMGANATGAGISFANTGSGNDLLGSGSTWSVSKAGTATFPSVAATALSTTGTTTLGNNTGTVEVRSNSWDISTSGAISGVTTLAMSDDLSLANGKAIKGTAVSGEAIKIQVYDNDTGPAYVDAITLTNGNAPAIAIGSNNETVAINSSDWDISTTGAMTGIGAITMDGLLTGTAGATITGATINLNASSNNAVNIGTGTTTSTVTIGGTGAQTVTIANGAAAKTLNLGSTNTTSTTNVYAGSGAINLLAAVAGDGSDTMTGFLRTVVDDADGEASLGVAESGSVQTNAGAGGDAAWVLPAAAPGLEFTFVVMAAQGLRVTPAAGDAINIGGSQGDAAEYWTANAVGESLTLIAVDANNWVAKCYTGTWTQQTP